MPNTAIVIEVLNRKKKLILITTVVTTVFFLPKAGVMYLTGYTSYTPFSGKYELLTIISSEYTAVGVMERKDRQ